MKWLDALEALDAGRADKVPDGFKTRAAIQAEMGWSTAHACAALGRLVAAGLAERRTFQVKSGAAPVRAVPHYKLADSRIVDVKTGKKRARIGRSERLTPRPLSRHPLK